MSKTYTPRGLAVPAGRISRAARLGGLTTGLLGAMATEGTRALARGERPRARDLLLTPANARRLTDELARMRGAAMKMGQLMSMEAGDMLPPELAQVLAHLRADAHFMPPKQLKQVLTTQYGADFLRRFQRFDTRPVAAASIGQVHRAIAKDGRVLALKIQYPGVRAAIDADVANLGTLLRLSGLLPRDLELKPFLEEARRQLHEEADYAREANELTRFGALIGDDPGITLPRVQTDFCTGDILAMDFVESTPIESLEEHDQATRDRAMSRLFRLFFEELFDWQVIQTDPNFANYRYQPTTDRLVLLDFGAARHFPEAFATKCRALLQASFKADREAVRAGLIDLGMFTADTPASQQSLILDMVDMALPMLQADSVDFGDTRLLTSMREKGMALGMEEDFRHIPPWDALYMQRKLAGLVLLATRLRARVPLRDLAAPYV
ncbi:MAG: AarF/ABC1/UbiB kinase family protein [Paracoccaceae bacterium]|nr:AarF/ABC1/UbiB kinase family protein [Paracoccaceae bacterium]